jgi:outer membrane protein OmpA-like peptidoglycan-associated protein
MADTFGEGRLRGEHPHRADEIHVHRQRRSVGLLLALLALIAIGLIAFWALQRDRDVELSPDVGIPRLEKPRLEIATPDVPAPSQPGMAPQMSPAAADVPAAAAENADGACPKEMVLHFTSNASKLREAEVSRVESIANCMKADPEMTARLEGRADPSGSSDHNQALALGRAQTVKQRLVELGVPESRLTVVVRGQDCEEATAACLQRNRSVTVISRR